MFRILKPLFQIRAIRPIMKEQEVFPVPEKYLCEEILFEH